MDPAWRESVHRQWSAGQLQAGARAGLGAHGCGCRRRQTGGEALFPLGARSPPALPPTSLQCLRTTPAPGCLQVIVATIAFGARQGLYLRRRRKKNAASQHGRGVLVVLSPCQPAHASPALTLSQTVPAGMGINNPHVRFVIHHTMRWAHVLNTCRTPACWEELCRSLHLFKALMCPLSPPPVHLQQIHRELLPGFYPAALCKLLHAVACAWATPRRSPHGRSQTPAARLHRSRAGRGATASPRTAGCTTASATTCARRAW